MYRLLLDFYTKASNVNLDQLYNAFTAITSFKIDKCDLEARFFSALAQLEYIGVVSSLNENFVKITYLSSKAALVLMP